METQSKQSLGSLIAFAAVTLIVLLLVSAVAGPGTRFGNAWQYLAGSTSGQPQTTGYIPAADSTSVVGAPSLSAQKIDSILCTAVSPACGAGSAFYANSAIYNIDDAVALAFFHHESSYGRAGAAIQTLNMGNIVCTAGYSCIGRFRSYSSWAAGIADWYRLISGPAYVGSGLTTLGQIIPKYAPGSDGNDPSRYISAVQSDMQNWRPS